MANNNFSIIIPAKNEAPALAVLLPKLKSFYKDVEIIVVNDGSTDNTTSIATENNVKLVSHPYSMGNGAAIKTGARNAQTETLIFMDADGQHEPKFIAELINKLEQGYEMVVGARSYRSQAGKRRWLGNQLYNQIASLIVGNKVEDLTSGFRVVDAKKFKSFLHLLPNGFSYPTTITMAFFRSGYPVAYVPIETKKRTGKSHLRLFKDGLRFLIIIFKIGTLYSPLKIFTPISAFLFLIGLTYYGYTFFNLGRFTNMSALLFIVSIIVFMIGLVSEQITVLLYKASRD
jgi:glycosyltransferase involved in cell wall biosynthesis